MEANHDSADPGDPRVCTAEADSPVGETNILLVGTEVLGKDLWGEYTYELSSSSIISASEPDNVIRTGSFADGLVSFNRLPPDDYALVRADGWRNTGGGIAALKMPISADPMHAITIEARDATCLGELIGWGVKEGRLGVAVWTVEWSQDSEEAALAWEELRDK